MAARREGLTIPLARPSLGEAELRAVERVFASGWAAGQGPACRALEAYVARETGLPYALAASNCTTALHMTLLALGIGAGAEVVVSDYSFPASAHAVAYTGATPRFADVEPARYATTADLLAAKIGPQTRALLVVHPFGLMPEMRPIRELADRRKLLLIEDAACAYGAQDEHGTGVGALADAVVFSFHARKNATCGEGGLLATPHLDVYEKARSLAFFGIASARERREGACFALPRFETLGYNYKLSDIQAAIALVQLERLPELIAEKARLAARYGELLAEVPGVVVPFVPQGARHTWQSYVVTLDAAIDRDAVITAMRGEGVETQIGTYAMHREPVYQSADLCPVSAACLRSHLALPLFAGLREEEQAEVVAALARVLAGKEILR